MFAFVSSGDGSPMTRIYNYLGGTIFPTGLNDLGQVVGDAYTNGNPPVSRAFVWHNAGPVIIDLGTLGGDNSYAFAINASGLVVGSSDDATNTARRCVIWDKQRDGPA